MSDAKSAVSVVLVDDHAVVREGYRRLLERTEDISVIAEVSTGEEAYRVVCELQPDVTVMDINLPGIGGIEVVRRIVSRLPEARILMFSMHEDTVFSSRALQAGRRAADHRAPSLVPTFWRAPPTGSAPRANSRSAPIRYSASSGRRRNRP